MGGLGGGGEVVRLSRDASGRRRKVGWEDMAGCTSLNTVVLDYLLVAFCKRKRVRCVAALREWKERWLGWSCMGLCTYVVSPSIVIQSVWRSGNVS